MLFRSMHVAANPSAEIGSIGTVAVLEDSSQKMEREGVKVHVVSTGPFKGIGVNGTPITLEGLEYLRSRVEQLHTFFQSSIQRGRSLSQEQLESVSDGRVFIAADAKRFKLIDTVMSFDNMMDMASISGHGHAGRPQKLSTRSMASNRLKLIKHQLS